MIIYECTAAYTSESTEYRQEIIGFSGLYGVI